MEKRGEVVDRPREMAQARWAILRRALLGPRGSPQTSVLLSASKRTFPGFELFLKKKEVEVKSEAATEPSQGAPALLLGDYVLIRYTAVFAPPQHQASSSTSVVVVERSEGAVLSRSELRGFDNTGNLGVWPSEEVLAHYCLQDPHLFRCPSPAASAASAADRAQEQTSL